MTLVVLLLIAPILISGWVFAVEVLVGLARTPARPYSFHRSAAVTIVIPAHNEDGVIAATLQSLKKAAGDDFAILVVADNCSDRTAEIARAMLADVVERHDMERRGKGFALAFARDRLRAHPPQAVIVLDADCSIDGASLRSLAGACLSNGRPAQAVYLFEPAPGASVMVQISSFAFLIKNLVRQRGLERLSGGVHLTGSGMCLSWGDFNRADMATSSIVEDARLGLELSHAGRKPQLVSDSIVWSVPAAKDDTLEQRSRWEGGVLALARAEVPRVLAQSIRTGSVRRLISGLDLLVPPLALLAAIYLVAIAATALLSLTGFTSSLPLLLLTSSGVLIGLAVLLAWWREGRSFLSPRAVARLPLYLLWKIPLYLSLARRGAPSNWVRTRRSDADSPDDAGTRSS